MDAIENLRDNIPTIEGRTGYSFNDRQLLELAFIHRSFVNENRDRFPEHNERLEFLGDSVLGLLISEYLYRELPDRPEGDLSYLRSRLVEASSCMEYLQQLEIGDFVLLGRGERMSGGRGRDSIFADLFEALIGAMYLDGGIETVRSFLFTHFIETFQKIIETPESNWKALLQDYTQKQFQVRPEYITISESGPDHQKVFQIAVTIGGKTWGEGSGASKKEAQQNAAQDAVKNLEKEQQQ